MSATPVPRLPSGDVLTGIHRILVFRALLLGDMLCAIPGWRALRRAWPEAKITLMSLRWAEFFVKRYPEYFDDFLEFPGHPDFPEQPARLSEWPGTLQRVQDGRYDLVIQQQGNGRVANAFCQLFGGRFTTGFCEERGNLPERNNFFPYPQHQPEIWRHLLLMRQLGAHDATDDSLEFPLHDQDRTSAQQVLRERGVDPDQPFVCLHPGAKAPERRWPTEAFGVVGRWLKEQGFQVLVTGTGDEAGLTKAVCQETGGQAIDLSGAFPDVSHLAALLAESRLLVCGDTGVSHLACAVQCPSVVIFTRAETEGWPPLDRSLHPVVTGIGGVDAAKVIAVIRDLLDRRRG